MRRLVIRPGAIGDTIVSLPALEHLCGGEKGVQAEIWAPARNLPLLKHIAPVHSFTEVQLDLLEINPPAALIERLQSFDEVVSWYGAAREEFRVALVATGVRVRLFPAVPPQNVGCHAVDFYLQQVGAETGGQAESVPRIPVGRGGGAKAGYIAIHPFSGSRRKNWPLELFRQVAEQLQAETGLGVEWCAGDEEELAEVRRFETLAHVAEWLSGASLYLGNDSGISHLAAACGAPTVAIFTASDPRVWAPRGAGVRVLVSPGVLDVLQACRELLRRAGPER
ncbi:MAG: glycosyltransferase family 9 protein [Bryobacteraceae bacterium]